MRERRSNVWTVSSPYSPGTPANHHVAPKKRVYHRLVCPILRRVDTDAAKVRVTTHSAVDGKSIYGCVNPEAERFVSEGRNGSSAGSGSHFWRIVPGIFPPKGSVAS